MVADFAKFVSDEAEGAVDPILSMNALKTSKPATSIPTTLPAKTNQPSKSISPKTIRSTGTSKIKTPSYSKCSFYYFNNHSIVAKLIKKTLRR